MASIASERRAACPDCVPFGSVFAVFIHLTPSARLLTRNVVEQKPELTQTVFKYVM